MMNLPDYLPNSTILRILPVYFNSGDVVVSLLGLMPVRFDRKDSQKEKQEMPSSNPGTEPHIWDQSSGWDESVLQVRKM